MVILRTSAVVLVALILTACGTTSEVPWKEGDAYVLQFRPSVDQVFDVELTNTNDMEMSLMGQQIPQRQEMTFNFTYEIQGADDEGLFLVRSTTDRLQSNSETMGQNMTFDSAEVGDRVPPVFRPLHAFIGSTVTMRVTPDGTVRSVDGLEELTQRMLDSIDMPNEQMNEQMRAQMEMTMGEDPLLENYKQVFRWYPDEPVMIGDSWTRSEKTYAGFPMESTMTLTLDRVEDGIAFISFTGEVGAEDSVMDMGPVSMNMSLSGSQEGSLQMDVRSGMVTQMSQTITSAAAGTMSSPADPSQEISMEMEGVSESTLSLTLRE